MSLLFFDMFSHVPEKRFTLRKKSKKNEFGYIRLSTNQRERSLALSLSQ